LFSSQYDCHGLSYVIIWSILNLQNNNYKIITVTSYHPGIHFLQSSFSRWYQ